MLKIQRISDFQHQFCFSSRQEEFSIYFERFLASDLGKIYQGIPWDDLVRGFGLKASAKGPDSIFSPRGKLALMFLKHYSCTSDKCLIEQLNGNLDWQFFCDLYLGLDRLDNYKLVSEIRCELSKKLDIDKVQSIFYEHWQPYIKDKACIVMDASCYESALRYPTDQKLLWESVHWSYNQLKLLCKALGVSLPRTKYLKWQGRYMAYSKMRRKTAKKKISLTRGLLRLLFKLNGLLDGLEQHYKPTMTGAYYKRRSIIKKIYRQQYDLFYKDKPPKERIVSIDKAYLRPIVRGKEIKPVEFGAKVNKFQIDGISFIEHLNFVSFHEGKRFKDTVFKAQRLTKTKVKLAGADAIYATNVNRRFATKNNIRTDFKRKGRAAKGEKQRKLLAKAITKERASRMEGSFGNEKQQYHLRKIKARTKQTETLWIFFGIHTANALQIGRRIDSQAIKKAA